MRTTQRGFTLIELLTVIAIAAILAMVAAPAFTKTIALQRVKSAATSLQQALYVARAEGVKRSANVCVSTSSTTCTGSGSWNQGWYVLDASNNVIGTYPAYPNVDMTGPSAGVTYQMSGRISATSSASFKVSSTKISDVRCVTITTMGVPTVTTSGC